MVVEVTAVEVLVILKRKLPLLPCPLPPLFAIAWKVTMVKEIVPGSDPDAKRQTFLF